MVFLIPEDSMIVGCMNNEIHNNISTPSGSDVKLCHGEYGEFLNIFSALVKKKIIQCQKLYIPSLKQVYMGNLFSLTLNIWNIPINLKYYKNHQQ